jgi:hypothetical protein
MTRLSSRLGRLALVLALGVGTVGIAACGSSDNTGSYPTMVSITAVAPANGTAIHDDNNKADGVKVTIMTDGNGVLTDAGAGKPVVTGQYHWHVFYDAVAMYQGLSAVTTDSFAVATAFAAGVHTVHVALEDNMHQPIGVTSANVNFTVVSP